MVKNRLTLCWTPWNISAERAKSERKNSTSHTMIDPTWALRTWGLGRAAQVHMEHLLTNRQNCPEHTWHRAWIKHYSSWNILLWCRLCSSADRTEGLVAAQLQWSCQSSLYSDQKQPDLFHHVPEVRLFASLQMSFCSFFLKIRYANISACC